MLDSLTGFFLIATSQMPDPRFAKKVIYMCRHCAEEGAMGFVINHPVPEITLSEVYLSMNLAAPDMELPHVFMGGPVNESFATTYNNKEKYCFRDVWAI